MLRPASLRKRLWQGGVALFVIIGTFTVGNFFVAPDKAVTSRSMGHDFLVFYTAGTFAREQRFDLLYNLDAISSFEHQLARQNNLELGDSFGPYWNPPFYAWMFAPISKMSYPHALIAWRCFSLLCFVAAIIVLIRMLPPVIARAQKDRYANIQPQPLVFTRDWKNWALVPLLICVSMPFIQAAGHAQNTFTSLLLLGLLVTAWRNRMPVAAGLVCGLLFYKPQLAAVIAVMLIFSMGLRVCLGLGFMAGVLLLITCWTMPESIGNYLTQLPVILKYMQVDHTYMWERHVTLKAFWRLLFQGRGPGETSLLVSIFTFLSVATIAAGLLLAWWRTDRCGVDDCWTGETRQVATDRLIGATITAMPLLMPFYFDYDLLLLSVAAVLLAGEILGRPPGTKLEPMQRLLVGAWIGLYVWLMVNPPLAGASGVNATVLLVAAVCALSIARAAHRGLRTTSLKLPQLQRVIVKRAA